MASEWFDSVTGRNDYERQSWRDSYNGGKAAGDWTGNHNARLDAERDAFGTTWSGSSSSPSALELAQAGGTVRDAKGNVVWTNRAGSGAGVPVATTPGVVVTAGPGSAGGQTVPAGTQLSEVAPVGPRAPAGVPGAGGPRRTVLSSIGVGGPLRSQIEPTVQDLLLGGLRLRAAQNTSNAEEWEIRYAEPGEWVGGLVVMGVDLGKHAAALVGWDSERSGRDIRYHAERAPAYVRDGITDFARYLDERRDAQPGNAFERAAEWYSSQPMNPSNSGFVRNSQGDLYMTGGGF